MRSIRYELKIDREEERLIAERLQIKFKTLFVMNDHASRITEDILNTTMNDKREFTANYSIEINADLIKLMLAEIREEGQGY